MLSLKALEIAKTQLGIVEEKGNKGIEVTKYLNSVGLGSGYSWCMAFIYWCFDVAAKEASVPNPLYKTGGVLKQLQKRMADVALDHPQPGDIGIMDFGKGLGHTFIVDTVDLVTKTVKTVEGNSNSKGSRTGGMVCSNTRKWSACKAFLRF